MADLRFVVDIETEKLYEKLKAIDQSFTAVAKEASKSGSVMDEVFSKAKGAENLGNSVSNVNKKMVEHSNTVKGYSNNINGLSMSVQQVARELPNAAISSQLFIMAISNNLPILADNIARVKAENAALKADGQSTIPVWKQVAGSIFSWQTALILGITAATMWGDKIAGWLTTLLKSKDAVQQLKDAQEELRQTTIKGQQDAEKDVTRLQLLYNAATDATAATNDRKAAVDELQKMYPDYLGNINDEAIKTGQAAEAYDKLRQSIINAAIAKAYEKKITEAQSKIIELDGERALKVAEFNKRMASASVVKTTPGGSQIRFGLGIAKANLTDILWTSIDDIDKEIAGLFLKIQEYSKNININDLLFGGKSDGKKSAESEKILTLSQQIADVTEKMLSADDKELNFLAAKRVLLEKELELRKWIAYEAYAAAKGDISLNDINPTALTTKGIQPITTEKGTITTNTKGQVIEITAVDKTGPTLKKVGLETDKLNKKVRKEAEQAAKDQEKLDKEQLDKKLDLQEQLISGARQYSSEILNQLGLSREQSAELEKMIDVMVGLSSGNWVGAAFGGLSLILGMFKNEKISTADAVNQQIEQTNKLLSLQGRLLDILKGSDYYKVSEQRLKQINSNLAMYNKQLQATAVFDSRTHQKINTSLWDYNKWITALNSPVYGGFDSDAVSATLEQIFSLKSEYNSLLQETYSTLLGFNANDVSSEIFDGIREGLRLGENELGGFAKSFGSLMEKAVMQAITSAANTNITDTFLPKVKEFLNNTEVGPNGEKLSANELSVLESLYGGIVKDQQAIYDGVKPIFAKYGTGTSSQQSAITGISAGATEDTVSAMVGQLMALRVDTKQIGTDLKTVLNFSQNQLELMDQQLSVLNQIAKNTQPLYRLEGMQNELAGIHQTLKSGL